MRVVFSLGGWGILFVLAISEDTTMPTETDSSSGEAQQGISQQRLKVVPPWIANASPPADNRETRRSRVHIVLGFDPPIDCKDARYEPRFA